MHLTSLCPDRCGHANAWAVFDVDSYLAFEKLGQYGDEKGTTFALQTHPADAVKHVAGALALLDTLAVGERVRLAWLHEYVTEHGCSSPARRVVRLDRIFEEDSVANIVSVSPPTRLSPAAFFLAWQGVLVLAFAGWPPSLASLKKELNAIYLLPTENAGSRWPKATLAATLDNAPPLTLEELSSLRDVCAKHAARLQAAGNDVLVPVDSLSVVQFTQRGLESAGTPVVRNLALVGPRDDAPVSTEELTRVQKTLGEWEGDALTDYLVGANRAGSRASSYRDASPPGVTLVAFARVHGSTLAGLLADFQREVDALLPGRFAWLDVESLHVTVRGLV
jgi:hypothetical protein